MKVGVLALQGGFEPHTQMLKKLGVDTCEVRTPTELKSCSGLILPGGESTVIRKLLSSEHLRDALYDFSQHFPLFGTCAGMIIMAQMGILDLVIERNAYGRQVSSFITPLFIGSTKIEGVFIRAPRIKALLSDRILPLAFFQEEPVLVKQGNHLACSFHPELSNDPFIHRYFLDLISP